ncbi:FCD domain-containing protein [Flaviflagellibacter deserti]|uniref:FCD domain-containing protein n=1 Tax=Flaviflagellibacter deserti TaxID=2267266 RepID=A0ABV9Z3J6_9HYPH
MNHPTDAAGTVSPFLSDLDIVKTASLTTVLEKEIERLILTGELEPGIRINEIHLSNRFGTSRGPLREATRSLEAKGLVEVIRNRGVFVRRLSVEDAIEIYDIRAALFGQAGRLVAERMDDKLLGELTRLVNRMDEIAETGDVDAYYPINLAFHNLIVTSCGNRTLAAEYQRFVNKLHLFRTRALVQSGGLKISNTEHRGMLEALASGDGDRAQLAHWRHVSLAKKRVLAAST